MSDAKPVAWLISGVDVRNGNPWRTASLHNAAADYRACEDLRDVTVGLLYSQETIDALQAEIEALRQKAGTGRAIIIDLLDQIESLQSYELTRDLEGYKAQAIWDSAIENAKRYAAIAKEKQQESLK